MTLRCFARVRSIEELAAHVAADECVEIGGVETMPPEAQNHPDGEHLAHILGRLLGGIIVVAVDEGLPQIGAAGQAGLFQPKRPVDPLPELLLVARACGRLDHEGHGYVVRVGILVLACLDRSGGRLVLHVSRAASRGGGACLGLATSASRKP